LKTVAIPPKANLFDDAVAIQRFADEVWHVAPPSLAIPFTDVTVEGVGYSTNSYHAKTTKANLLLIYHDL